MVVDELRRERGAGASREIPQRLALLVVDHRGSSLDLAAALFDDGRFRLSRDDAAQVAARRFEVDLQERRVDGEAPPPLRPDAAAPSHQDVGYLVVRRDVS